MKKHNLYVVHKHFIRCVFNFNDMCYKMEDNLDLYIKRLTCIREKDNSRKCYHNKNALFENFLFPFDFRDYEWITGES